MEAPASTEAKKAARAWTLDEKNKEIAKKQAARNAKKRAQDALALTGKEKVALEKKKAAKQEIATETEPAIEAKPKRKVKSEEDKQAEKDARSAIRKAAHVRLSELVDLEASKRVCVCGCDTNVKGFFAPGHDAKLLSRIMEDMVKPKSERIA